MLSTTMYPWTVGALLALLLSPSATAFELSVPQRQHRATTTATQLHQASSDSHQEERHTLGLLTFDLDDTLFPISVVEEEANQAFVKAMGDFGYKDLALTPANIVQAAQQIRQELSEQDPAMAASLTHKELRDRAIRREMERCIVQRKLKDCAEDWVTDVESLSPLVQKNAKRWAQEAVNDNVVQAVSTAWEMARHHSAERELYPEVLDVLKQIKEQHPDAIIGAVTDGRSNPLFMTFTLAPYFDFRCSWEDDQAQFQRKQFFQKLEGAQGIQQLSWIYDEARFYYSTLKKAKEGMAKKDDDDDTSKPLVFPDTYDDRVWIHVGDDLALDVGGSAACGAKTIYAELDPVRYHQSARFRYKFCDDDDKQQEEDEGSAQEEGDPATWSTTPESELKARCAMAKAAQDKVSVKLRYLTQLPDAINDILVEGNH